MLKRLESEQFLRALFQRSQEAGDRRAAEIRAQAKAEADRTIQELRKSIASLTSRWGQFVENLIEPAVAALFEARGIAVEETLHRMKSFRPGVAREIHILVVDGAGDVAVAIEVKSRLSKGDVDEFIEKLSHFKQAFPRYADAQIHGALAGIEIDEGVDRYAYRQGLFVIKQSGETVTIAKDPLFNPAKW